MLLDLRGVTKRVRAADDTELQILAGVDLAVDEGDRVSIVGRSGSGKSTLLNIIGLLDAPSSGELRFDDHDVMRMSAPRRDRMRGGSIGFIFQQFNLLQGRTAAENVALPLLYDTSPAFWRRRAVAVDMLERVGLGHRVDATPDKLSGGEQQRVAIARALVRSPRLILADEPTGALDVETGQVVMELLDEITAATGAAVITITHDVGVARRAARRFRLADGVLHDESGDAAGDDEIRGEDAGARCERALVVTGAQTGAAPSGADSSGADLSGADPSGVATVGDAFASAGTADAAAPTDPGADPGADPHDAAAPAGDDIWTALRLFPDDPPRGRHADDGTGEEVER